jgi:hypothetical protein
MAIDLGYFAFVLVTWYLVLGAALCTLPSPESSS